MQKPFNDSALSPELILFYYMQGRTEERERDCTQSLANSDCLPADMRGEIGKTLKEKGVQILDPVEDDPMFVYVVLPEGWTMKMTSHNWWINLCDEGGEVVAKVFFKGSPHDRSAYMRAPYKS